MSYISQLQVKGLWEQYNFNWDLNSKVNILSGINGSGKTSILEIIHWMATQEDPRKMHEAIKDAVLKFDDICRINFNTRVFAGKREHLERKAKKDVEYKRFINHLKNKEGEKYNSIDSLHVEVGRLSFSPNKEVVTKDIKIDYIKSFDGFIKTNEDIKKISDDEIKTELDLRIYHLQRQYLDYKINISKRKDKILEDTNIEDEYKLSLVRNVSATHELFIQTINQMFEATNKEIDKDSNELKFISAKKPLKPYSLSSGEKQLVVILLTTLLQDNKSAILLLDEPEISLHFDWQADLISCITKLNPEAQIILATHSPAIIMKSWQENVTNILDITTKY